MKTISAGKPLPGLLPGVRRAPVLAGIAALAVMACGSQPAVLRECQAADGLEPLCGFQNPEDMALLPGGVWLVVSQMAQEAESSGSLIALRPSDGARRPLFPPAESDASRSSAAQGWGDPTCPGPPDAEGFAPHGIDVGHVGVTNALAVINHGEREAVELFEIQQARGPALAWRGCVPLPDDASANDVVWLPRGGLVVTRMFPRAVGLGRLALVARMLFGADTGYLLEWASGQGWTIVPESHGAAPNGLASSADGLQLYFAEWIGKKLVRIRRGGDAERREIDLPHHGDNLTWSRDGHLLVTGQAGGLGDALACGGVTEGSCALPFSVLAVDPVTLETRIVLDHPATAIGAASVAIQVGDDLYIGAFRGDRIARTPYPE